ncbi:MAG: chorismate mutase [Sulfolobales archaeon]
MSSIDEIRAEIDRVDEELVRLLARRIRLVKEIATIKMRECIKLVNQSREAEVLSRIRKLSSELGVSPDTIEFLFRAVMMMSLKEEVIHIEEHSSNRCSGKDG